MLFKMYYRKKRGKKINKDCTLFSYNYFTGF